ncbi:Lrp/AsnC family transcriptional regulator [Streptomyces endophyticus]|uniref:Lrp/AsnC family transcriptional regulator n=1 Tax=Streptomyces endophyticus TaxID=714166 RepID=A0ABU6FCW8_9ACTN|nr:Lrp/AsnC family transcriptional regulator [Streptomyces endophyticus]MEB8341477.1 Lrp/AsnC family transcriptional regulator [Streptomyces endophyticus]
MSTAPPVAHETGDTSGASHYPWLLCTANTCGICGDSTGGTIRTGESAVSEADLTLIHALQLAPRASWAQLAAEVGHSPGTLNRRWARLTEAGVAWSGVLPGAMFDGGTTLCSAWIQVRCGAGSVAATAAELARDPGTLCVVHLAGAADLLVYYACYDTTALDRYLGERLHLLPGVRATRAHLITKMHGPLSPLRLHQLGPDIRRRLSALAPSPSPGAARQDGLPDATDRVLLHALAGDARLGATVLAKACGLSETTVRRRIDRLEARSGLHYMVKLAPRYTSRPLLGFLYLNVPPEQVTQTAATVLRQRGTRHVSSVTGPHNLLVCAWLRSPAQLAEYAERLTRAVPAVRVTETTLALRIQKLGGQILAPDGTRERFVAPDLWGTDPHAR